MTINEKLTELAKDRNRAEVCRRAGMHPKALASYIHKGCVPSAENAFRLARVLHVSVEWLLDDAQGWPPVWANYPAEAVSAEAVSQVA